jgi:hypothetical protein
MHGHQQPEVCGGLAFAPAIELAQRCLNAGVCVEVNPLVRAGGALKSQQHARAESKARARLKASRRRAALRGANRCV